MMSNSTLSSQLSSSFISLNLGGFWLLIRQNYIWSRCFGHWILEINNWLIKGWSLVASLASIFKNLVNWLQRLVMSDSRGSVPNSFHKCSITKLCGCASFLWFILLENEYLYISDCLLQRKHEMESWKELFSFSDLPCVSQRGAGSTQTHRKMVGMRGEKDR